VASKLEEILLRLLRNHRVVTSSWLYFLCVKTLETSPKRRNQTCPALPASPIYPKNTNMTDDGTGELLDFSLDVPNADITNYVLSEFDAMLVELAITVIYENP